MDRAGRPAAATSNAADNAAGTLSPPAGSRPRSLTSSEILRGERWVEILHNGEIYRLQATRLGKLILTK